MERGGDRSGLLGILEEIRRSVVVQLQYFVEVGLLEFAFVDVLNLMGSVASLAFVGSGPNKKEERSVS